MLKSVLPLILVLSAFAPAADVAWLDDLDAAKAAAAKEGKDIILLFDCSDSAESIAMHKKYLDTEDFAKLAAKFVLVRIDAPIKDDRTAEAKKKASDAIGYYDLDGIPTIVVMDDKARAYAVKAGLIEGGDEVLGRLFAVFEKARAGRDKMLDIASKMPAGDERAQVLAYAFGFMASNTGLSSWSPYGYEELFKEIAALDPENRLGHKATFEFRDAIFRAKLLTRSKDHVGAIAVLDKFLSDYKDSKILRQFALYAKANVLAQAGDDAAAIECMKQAVAIDPETKIAKEIAGLLKEIEAPKLVR